MAIVYKGSLAIVWNLKVFVGTYVIYPDSFFLHQAKGLSGIGLRPHGFSNTVSGMGPQQSQSQYCLPQMSSSGQPPNTDLGSKSAQASQSTPDPFGLHGLLSVVHMKNPDLTSLAIGVDLTTLGLNLNSAEKLHKTFSSPWSEEPAKCDPEFSIPQFYSGRPSLPLHVRSTVFVIIYLLVPAFFFSLTYFLYAGKPFFQVSPSNPVLHILQVRLSLAISIYSQSFLYFSFNKCTTRRLISRPLLLHFSMPKDEMQIYAANEL